MFTPFVYSQKRELTTGFNDEEHLQVNGRDKINVDEYMAIGSHTDVVVVPCEQVTHESGKKKRKRALKMSIK